MLFSFIAVLRGARRVGRADLREKAGDLAGALRVWADGLRIVGDKRVDLEAPWCQAVASVMLFGYCRVAQQLGLETESFEMLTRWRPAYLEWLESTTYPVEKEYLTWLEALFQQHLRNTPRH
jgi:hypothetical protein